MYCRLEYNIPAAAGEERIDAVVGLENKISRNGSQKSTSLEVKGG